MTITCVYQWLQNNSAIATWALFGAALGAAILAIKNLRRYKEQLEIYKREVDLVAFSNLLKELSDPDASIDRGLVMEHISPGDGLNRMERLVKQGRAGGQATGARVGRAVELTIARMDRIGFFLLGEDDKKDDETRPKLRMNPPKLRMNPPKWLRTMVCRLWKLVGEWVEHRASKEADAYWQHDYYGYYFKRLNDWYSENPERD